MAKLLIVLNHQEVRNILRSPRVQADLKARADRIAQRATQLASEAGHGDALFVSEVGAGAARGRARVITANAEAMVAEAAERVLTRSFDAGRG